MSKSPYEIRLELLKLANEVLLTPVYQKRSALEMEWTALREVNPSAPFPTMPEFPDTNKIIAEAERLKSFVDNDVA